jgi:hypothetical protein
LASFPRLFLEPFAVPDSVEVCDMSEFGRDDHRRVFVFGRESKLRLLRIRPSKFPRVFLQIPSPVLKAFGSALEFSGSHGARPPFP